MVNLSQTTVKGKAVECLACLFGRRVANGAANLVLVCVVVRGCSWHFSCLRLPWPGPRYLVCRIR